MIVSIEQLAALLRKRWDDSDVTALIGDDPGAIERVEHLGYVNLEPLGISVMFAEAAYVLPQKEIIDPSALYVNCFHLHREGHEGYTRYRGLLPGGVAFGHCRSEIVEKLGEPIATGGGGLSSIVGRTIPKWIRYAFGGTILQFQLDALGRMDMVSLYVPEPRQ